MPKRRAGSSPAGRIALLHAIAHIELNAIDLAWDIIARFAGADLPRQFYDDWVGVAAEEAEHYALLAERLTAFGAAYGDLPAHDGLWQAAEATAHDLLARLAVVPLVLEARGLDVTPAMIARLDRVGDGQSAAVLRRIYADAALVQLKERSRGIGWPQASGCARASAPVIREASAASRNRSMSPLSTAWVLLVSTPVRRSFTI